MMHFLTKLIHFIFLCYAVSHVSGFNAMRGRDTRVPCGQGQVVLDGPEAYVVWLKNDRDLVYKFPTEDSEKRIAENFGSICESSSGSCDEESSLVIYKATEQDAGQYRCRIHYEALPTADYVVNVTIVDPPDMPKIYSKNGDVITQGYVGPFGLGSDVVLRCKVENQLPETQIYWRRDGKTVLGANTSGPNWMRAIIFLPNLTRNEFDAKYECVSQNADVSEPQIASVVIKMFLPPLSAEIRLNNNYDFEEGQPRVVDCVVVGCVPAPSVTWQIGDRMLRPNVHKELHDGNYTVSSLTLTASLHDNGEELICRAHNSHLPGGLFEDKVTLNVGYRPVCQKNGVQKVGVAAGETETLTCLVDASPKPLQFIWTFANSKNMYTRVTKLASYRYRYASTLTWVVREDDIGLLHCRATNKYGEQKQPCKYNITAGGPPSDPKCEMFWAYPNSLRAKCNKGWDGGRTQTINLEIHDQDGTLIKNASDVAGHFFIPLTMSSRNLTAVLYASNIRGRSKEEIIDLKSLKAQGPPAHSTTNAWIPYLEAFIGTLAFIMAVSVLVVTVRMLIIERRNGSLTESNPDLPQEEGAYHRELDFIREERLLGTTNITVNQLAACRNQYSSSPVPACRVLGRESLCSPDIGSSSLHSYYV